jgi:cobalt transporter subunit CbtB
MTIKTVTITHISVKQRAMVGLAALTFGLFIVFTAGFAHSSTLHNAAHDTRHSVGFPCH